MPVSLRTGSIERPTYRLGPPDPEPPLLPGFGPRGAPIYPYPVYETFASRPTLEVWRTVELENEYLRLTFLPQLNARLYSIIDKLTGLEVLYANPEMKPALVGLRGAWYATGIEIDFPCSHTVTTADAIACEHWLDDDGAGHFRCWDHEAVSGMSWMAETVLRPACARVELTTHLANPTDLPHRYYFWVNAAFPIRDQTRYVYPASTRRIWTHPPIDGGQMGLLDYPVHRGVDVSLFRNLHRHSSLFAETCDEGFFGLHHGDTDTGVAHIADPSLVPGRKVWSWGFAPDGRVWHDRLTDTGGPYCELQSGPLRNQNEFRTLAPGQRITQRDVWLPTRGLGGLSYANEEIAAHWRIEGDQLLLQILSAETLAECHIELSNDDDESATTVPLGPEPVCLELRLPPGATMHVTGPASHVSIATARIEPGPSRTTPRLRAARPATPTQLGRWHEWQGNRPRAAECYREDAEQSAFACAALARLAYERDDLDEAWRWARRAEALDWHEPQAVLIAALVARERGDVEAARWRFEQLAGYPETRGSAMIGLLDLDWPDLGGRPAIGFAQRGTDCRLAGRLAVSPVDDLPWAWLRSLPEARLDPLLTRALTGRHTPEPPLTVTACLAATEQHYRLPSQDPATWAPNPGTPSAMVDYRRAYEAGEPLTTLPPWPVGFAHGRQAIRILTWTVREMPDDFQARYHLACALAAAGDWETACCHWAVCEESPLEAMACRNLGLAAWQIHRDLPAAEAFYRRAVAAGAGARTRVEHDLLLAEMGRHAERVALLEAAMDPADDDTRLPLRLAAALLDAGRPADAVEALGATEFQLYEGGGLPQHLWRQAHRALAEAASGPLERARCYLAATEYPPSLGVGAPAENRDCELFYLAGEALTEAGDPAGATSAYAAGAETGDLLELELVPLCELQPECPSPGIVGWWLRNRAYRALCLRRLGHQREAAELLDALAAEAAGDASLAAFVAGLR